MSTSASISGSAYAHDRDFNFGKGLIENGLNELADKLMREGFDRLKVSVYLTGSGPDGHQKTGSISITRDSAPQSANLQEPPVEAMETPVVPAEGVTEPTPPR